MREIKFRAWDFQNNSMHEVNIMMIGFGSSSYNYPNEGEEADVGTMDTNRVLMQYTGLKDKNGKEIYEGDILLYPNTGYDPSRGDNPNELSKVIFKDGGFYADDYGVYEIDLECEVIGNIYENPELL